MEQTPSLLDHRYLSYSFDVLHILRKNDDYGILYTDINRKAFPRIRKIIDVYSITECILGSSSFSSVFLGYNDALKKKVAVKFIQSFRKRYDYSVIENEVNLLKKMKDSNKIVRLEDFLIDEDQNYYMVFELAENNLLNYYIMNNDFFRDESFVCMVFRKIVDSLRELHDHNIVHRDLKLENVFVFNSRDSRKPFNFDVKIGDLGLSTICEKNQKLTQYCGSPLYSAPEVNKGIPYNGYKYDIWSLGIILYYLIYGNFPFNVYKHEISKENQEEDMVPKIITRLFQKIQTEDVTFDEDKQISEPCKTLITSLLSKNPEKRPFVEDIIKHSWMKGIQF